MSWHYLIAPFAAWLVAGCLKFAINTLRAGKPAFGLIGYGGMPSNHSAIVSCMAVLIALREGIGHPAFGVALTLAFIVLLDASSLRRQVGAQARAINQLNGHTEANPAGGPGRLRERIGHTRAEIGGGILTGAVVAWLLATLLP